MRDDAPKGTRQRQPAVASRSGLVLYSGLICNRFPKRLFEEEVDEEAVVSNCTSNPNQMSPL